MQFYTGLHQVSDAKHFGHAFISVNRLIQRKSDFSVKSWIMDSGAFSSVSKHGGYPDPVKVYADRIKRWKGNGTMQAAVSQDYMCESFILERTGMTVHDHQRLTIERYDELLQCDTGVAIMPVLQGYTVEDYLRHIEMYGERLNPNMWVGVGSVCKRNGDPQKVRDIFMAINLARPDLRLHGFGIKTTSLADGVIRSLLHSADSMAWSFAARRVGRNQNDWREAMAFTETIASLKGEYQGHLLEALCQN